MRLRAVQLVMVAVLVSLWIGCGPDNPLGRKAVSGKVTLNGQPVKGFIRFAPSDQGQTPSGATILEGAYSIRADKGLVPGEYTVLIQVPDPNWTPQEGLNPKNIAPDEFKNSSQKIKVTEDGPNEFSFDMKGQ